MTDKKTAESLEFCVGVILAAGMGTRMKSDRPKVLHSILGKPLILWSADSLVDSGITKIIFVISPGQTALEKSLHQYGIDKNIHVKIAYQEIPQGTGHAAKCAFSAVKELLNINNINPGKAHVVIGFGDTPAVQSASFLNFCAYHLRENNSFTILGFTAQNPRGYGRIVTDKNNKFIKICEDKDCDASEKLITLCNSGFLCAKYNEFETYLPRLTCNNKAKEYYLTELPLLALGEQKPVGVFAEIDEAELAGVNSQQQLTQLAKFLQSKVLEKLMENGVQILNPDLVYLEPTVSCGRNVIIEPFVYLGGATSIPNETRVLAFSKIIDNNIYRAN